MFVLAVLPRNVRWEVRPDKYLACYTVEWTLAHKPSEEVGRVCPFILPVVFDEVTITTKRDSAGDVVGNVRSNIALLLVRYRTVEGTMKTWNHVVPTERSAECARSP